MRITVLPNKYRIGSNRGIMALDEPGILSKFNSIVCWDSSLFPLKPKENETDPDIEDREFLGPEPELVPGSMFIVKGGQVLAVENPDRFILVMSETGPLALQNLYQNEITLEFELKFDYWEGQATYEKKEPQDIPADYESYTVPYNLMMVFRNNFLEGRDLPKKGLCLEVKYESDNFLLPITIYIQDWKISYNPIEVDPEQAPDMAKEVIAWFYNNYFPPKLEYPKEEEKQELAEDKTALPPQP